MPLLTLDIPDSAYEPMLRAAARAGQKPEDWAIARLRAAAPSAQEWQQAMDQLMRHVGAASLGRPTGVCNEAIDADLAREYLDPHEAAG